MTALSNNQADTTKPGMTLGTKILFGVLVGLAAGIFFGDLVAPLQIVGDVYIGLLQMIVLPYIFVSLVSKIGRFTFERARQVAGHALVVQFSLWAIVLAVIVLLPYSLPEWEAGTFFSSSSIEEGDSFNLVDLYVPSNPFESFAANIVPAAVVFSILLGVALIPIAECPSSNKWNRRSNLLMESFVPHGHVTRRVVDSANDASQWSVV